MAKGKLEFEGEVVGLQDNDGIVNITLRGAVLAFVANLDTDETTAVKATRPDGVSEVFTSDRDPKLFDKAGKERPFTPGTKLEPVATAQAS